MGGCRCTYRNCTIKSNKETHLFHYPVFDRVRCHQWLLNAQRLDFLNLKVSQLKNRVVCQHHFKDDYFMNFKKDKLTFDAVPTEDGPFCDSSNQPYTEFIQADHQIIIPEDIENDQLSMKEKKANFSVKYGDFLINSEMMDNFTLNPKDTIKYVKANEYSDDFILPTLNIAQPDNFESTTVYTHKSKVSLPPETNNKSQYQPMVVVPPYSDNSQVAALNAPGTELIELEIGKVPSDIINGMNTYDVKISKPKQNIKTKKKSNRVQIISEKKISEPLPLTGKLEPVSPSLILRVHDKNKRTDVMPKLDGETGIKQNDSAKVDSITADMVESATVLESTLAQQVNPEQSSLEFHNVQYDILSSLAKLNNQNIQLDFQTSPSVSYLKNKIPPERVAAIEQKRKFNMKLRDAIESCLDELEDRDKKTNEENTLENKVNMNIYNEPNPVNKLKFNNKMVKSDERKLTKKGTENFKLQSPILMSKNLKKDSQNDPEKVASFLGKEPSLPTFDEYSIASLEARMKRMEDTLLRKIGQNSERIIDLKKSLVGSPSVNQKTVPTQTIEDEESYKKRLFQEISQFLSPNANSVIYEELFLSKYVQDTIKGSLRDPPVYSQLPKRRRRR